MERLTLPATVEHFIRELHSSEDLQLKFKIIDNIDHKTVVLTWSNPTLTRFKDSQAARPRKHKSRSQLNRDFRRRTEFRAKQQQAYQLHLEHPASTNIGVQTSTPQRDTVATSHTPSVFPALDVRVTSDDAVQTAAHVPSDIEFPLLERATESSILDTPSSSILDTPSSGQTKRKNSLRSAKNRPKLVLQKKRIRGERDFVSYCKTSKLYTFSSCLNCCSPCVLYDKIDRIAKLYESSIEGDTSTVEWICNYCGKPTTCSDSDSDFRFRFISLYTVSYLGIII